MCQVYAMSQLIGLQISLWSYNFLDHRMPWSQSEAGQSQISQKWKAGLENERLDVIRG